MKFKKGLAIRELVLALIALVVLVLMIGVIWILKEKGFEGVLAGIKNLLRFGRA